MEPQKPNKDSINKNQSCAGPLSCTGLVFLVVILPVVILGILWATGKYLVTSDTLQPSDAVVALSGAENSNRMDEAEKLYQEGLARWVILTETGEVYPETTALLSSIYKNELVEMGVPEDAILITDKVASSTWGEARVVRKLMLREGFTSCIVVTDPYHTRRVRIVFEDEFQPHNLTLIVRSTSKTWFRPSRWWMSNEGWNVVISEYSKLLGYFLGMKQY